MSGADSAPGGRSLPDSIAIWILRHGETEWSASGQHTGRTDLPLTPAGEAQARALGNMLADRRPTYVLSSPRTRALDTARLAGLTVDEVTEDLAEWDYGDYEGRTTAEIREDVPDWSIWTHGAPNGETPEQVGARADRVLARALDLLSDSADSAEAGGRAGFGPIALVGHGHFSRMLGARWIGLPVDGGAHLLLGTAAPALLGAQYGEPVLDHWNTPNPAARK